MGNFAVQEEIPLSKIQTNRKFTLIEPTRENYQDAFKQGYLPLDKHRVREIIDAIHRGFQPMLYVSENYRLLSDGHSYAALKTSGCLFIRVQIIGDEEPEIHREKNKSIMHSVDVGNTNIFVVHADNEFRAETKDGDVLFTLNGTDEFNFIERVKELAKQYGI